MVEIELNFKLGKEGGFNIEDEYGLTIYSDYEEYKEDIDFKANEWFAEMLDKIEKVSTPFYEVVRDNLYHTAEWEALREMYVMVMEAHKTIEYNYSFKDWLIHIVEIPEKQLKAITDTKSSIILEEKEYEWEEYKDWHFVKFKI